MNFIQISMDLIKYSQLRQVKNGGGTESDQRKNFTPAITVNKKAESMWSSGDSWNQNE